MGDAYTPSKASASLLFLSSICVCGAVRIQLVGINLSFPLRFPAQSPLLSFLFSFFRCGLRVQKALNSFFVPRIMYDIFYFDFMSRPRFEVSTFIFLTSVHALSIGYLGFHIMPHSLASCAFLSSSSRCLHPTPHSSPQNFQSTQQ